MSVTFTTGHPHAQCVDLRATFAGRFRFAFDEAYAAEDSRFRASEAAWLTFIPCKAGRIFPWGGRQLGAYCNAGAAKRRELEAVSGVTIAQGGERCPETAVTFDVDRLEAVAAVLGAKRPRRLSDEQRAVCSARLRQFAAARRDAQNPHVRPAPVRLDSTIGAPDVFADGNGGRA